MSAARLLGIEPESLPRVRRLGLLMGLTTAAEILAEGVVLSAFLSRVGAIALPTALALRAVVEVLLSVAAERGLARVGAARAMCAVVVACALLLTASAALLSTAAGAYAAYVLVSSVARLKTIHFGVLALADWPGLGAARVLPVIHAGGRLGGVAAGPVLALLGPKLSSHWAVALSAALYVLALVWVRGGPGAAPSRPPPAQGSATERDRSGLLTAIVVGAVALAIGRLALVTQSGAVLEAAYGEADLNRVLGAYFTGANLVAFLLQVLVVGRVLGAGGLPWLNSGWAFLYLAAQSLLSFGPPWVVVALAARLVESELRNALRTPVASLLYEAMPAARRAFARTLVIGVAVPAASLAGGLGLGLMRAHPTALSALGLGAAVVIVLATWAQNRGYRRARA